MNGWLFGMYGYWLFLSRRPSPAIGESANLIVFSGPPQQITVMEHRLFGHIDLIEFKGCAWMKARQGTDTEKCVPPVVAMETGKRALLCWDNCAISSFFRIGSRFCARGETPAGFEWLLRRWYFVSRTIRNTCYSLPTAIPSDQVPPRACIFVEHWYSRHAGWRPTFCTQSSSSTTSRCGSLP
jgi:hypothetical protein